MASTVSTCIVCGAKSHRGDWANKQNPACEVHSQAEVSRAIQSRVTKPEAAAPQGVTVTK